MSDKPAKPKRPSADSTRKAILQHARAAFIEKGFAGASVADIAKRAKVNKSLLYHHFESKEGLWHEVKLEMLGLEYDDRVRDLMKADISAREFISRYLRMKLDSLLKYPELVRLVQWQLLEPDFEKLMSVHALGEQIKAKFDEFQKKGEIRRELSLDVMRVLVIGSPVALFGVAQSLYPNTPKFGTKEYEQLATQIVDMVTHQLLP